jgi:DNA-binding CsgD family transcriptional regulator
MLIQRMVWLDEADLHAARSLRRALAEAQTSTQVAGTILDELVQLVPADVVSRNRIALATGAVMHEAVPAAAEPPGAFQEVAPTAGRHPLLHPHAVRARSAVRLSDAVEPRLLRHTQLYGDLLHRSGAEYGISISVRPWRGEAVVFALGRHERQFSQRDRDVLDLACPAVEEALEIADARERVARALAFGPPRGIAVAILDVHGEIEQSSPDADRWLAEHFGPAEHPAWLPGPVASWLALPPRPPLVSVRPGRRLTVRLLPGAPHILLLEEEVGSFRAEALERTGVNAREREVLQAAQGIGEEVKIADELFLSLHAVRQRLARLEQKLGAETLTDSIAAALEISI